MTTNKCLCITNINKLLYITNINKLLWITNINKFLWITNINKCVFQKLRACVTFSATTNVFLICFPRNCDCYTLQTNINKCFLFCFPRNCERASLFRRQGTTLVRLRRTASGLTNRNSVRTGRNDKFGKKNIFFK